MEMEIKNKVAESALLVLNLSDFLPKKEILAFDIQQFLFRGLILKEKDFREQLAAFDFAIYGNKTVNIFCSADAVIPMWAYMLVVKYLQPFTESIYVGNAKEIKKQICLEEITRLDANLYADKSIILKGCGDDDLGEELYVAMTKKLLPVCKMLMYGEPCSTVPIFKKKN